MSEEQTPIQKLALRLGAEPEKINELSEDNIDAIANELETKIVTRHISDETEPIKGLKSSVNDSVYLKSKEKVVRKLSQIANADVRWDEVEDKFNFDPFTLLEDKKIIPANEYEELISKGAKDETLVNQINDLKGKLSSKDEEITRLQSLTNEKVQEIESKYIQKDKDTYLLENITQMLGEGKVKGDKFLLDKFKFGLSKLGIDYSIKDGGVKIFKASDKTDFYLPDENGTPKKVESFDRALGEVAKIWSLAPDKVERSEPKKKGVLDKSKEIKAGSQAERFAKRRGLELPN